MKADSAFDLDDIAVFNWLYSMIAQLNERQIALDTRGVEYFVVSRVESCLGPAQRCIIVVERSFGTGHLGTLFQHPLDIKERCIEQRPLTE
jgi:hypothetical protein